MTEASLGEFFAPLEDASRTSRRRRADLRRDPEVAVARARLLHARGERLRVHLEIGLEIRRSRTRRVMRYGAGTRPFSSSERLRRKPAACARALGTLKTTKWPSPVVGVNCAITPLARPPARL